MITSNLRNALASIPPECDELPVHVQLSGLPVKVSLVGIGIVADPGGEAQIVLNAAPAMSAGVLLLIPLDKLALVRRILSDPSAGQ